MVQEQRPALLGTTSQPILITKLAKLTATHAVPNILLTGKSPPTPADSECKVWVVI